LRRIQQKYLGIEHLEKVGEKVKIHPISDRKFKLEIKCTFADAVHPFIPIEKCLWVKYLASIIRRVLPSDKELKIHNSEFDDNGSITLMEIKNKAFITIN
jgi:hypothetical protein